MTLYCIERGLSLWASKLKVDQWAMEMAMSGVNLQDQIKNEEI